ncbi:MAG: hypothetical protein IPL61_24480 [Myxococcales bacterium]|nr:hypothetical protein [Myxococcales bacterium]
MNHHHRRVAQVVISVVLASAPAAQAEPPARVLIETDPATFAFAGYALHVRLAPRAAPGWTVGVGTYAMDLPDALVGAAPANHGEGWHQRIRAGYGLFVDRDLDGDAAGTFVGAQLAVQRLALTRDEAPADTRVYTAGLVMARVGYLWFPTRRGLYVVPWAGVGATAALAGERELAGETYQVFPAVAFAAVHVGWRL